MVEVESEWELVEGRGEGRVEDKNIISPPLYVILLIGVDEILKGNY